MQLSTYNNTILSDYCYTNEMSYFLVAFPHSVNGQKSVRARVFPTKFQPQIRAYT